MAISIVTQGYLYSTMLVLALVLAKPQNQFGFRKVWETKLAQALALGLFIVGMIAYAEITQI